MNKLLRAACVVTLLLIVHAAHAVLPIQHWQTSRGARVLFVENHDLPMLDVNVDFPAGAGFDTREKSGAASMTNNMLRLGAAGMDENEIARMVADVGAHLGNRFEGDRAGLGVRTLSSPNERRHALDIMARLLAHPAFPSDVLEREKVRLIAILKEADTKPDTIVSVNFSRLAYPGHPYGLRSSGDVDTVSKLTRDDLVAFHRAHYNAGNAVVALMGDVTRDEAAAISETLTKDLPTGTVSTAAIPDVEVPARGTTEWIPHRAAQSHILMGAPGIRRNDPDYFALYVGNYILGGGGFVSRIFVEVREKRGLAYSAYSYFTPMLREGPFLVGMQTKAGQAKDALDVARSTLATFVTTGPTQQELDAAKKNIVGSFPLRIDSNRKIAEYLSLIGFYRLPLTYLDDFVKNVQAVTLEQIKTAFQRHVHPDRLITVVVGPVDQKAAAATQ